MIEPPNTKKELFARLVDIVQHGFYKMPDKKRYNGTGAPGNFLEDVIGLTAGNKDIPDSVGWELKFYTRKTNLITLFHKDPQPQGILRYIVSKFGWKDKKDRLSFRHTIAGKSDRFKVEEDAGQIIVRPLKGNGPVPYWTNDSILSAAGGKIRRLLLVMGTRKGKEVRFERVTPYEELQLSDFIYELKRGTIRIDFDVRESKPGSKGLRNHGTKFRISPYNVCRIYGRKNRIC